MKVLIQRVKRASVTIDNKLFSEINHGLLVFLGVEKNDSEKEIDWLANKILNLRIFEDENEKMNYSVKDVNGEILLVSQFTLAGNCQKGNRPSFDKAMYPDDAKILYEKFIETLKKEIPTQTGSFGAMMEINLLNDGPVTFMIEKQFQE